MPKCKTCSLDPKVLAETDKRILEGEDFSTISAWLRDQDISISNVSLMSHAEKHVKGYVGTTATQRIKVDSEAIADAALALQDLKIKNLRNTNIGGFDVKQAIADANLDDLMPGADIDDIIDKLQSVHIALHLKQALLVDHTLNQVISGELPYVPSELYRNMKITAEVMMMVSGIDILVDRAKAIQVFMQLGLNPDLLVEQKILAEQKLAEQKLAEQRKTAQMIIESEVIEPD